MITDVAEVKCPWCQHRKVERPPLSDCPNCQGTGLRWPTLSRECPGTSYPPYPNDVHHHQGTCLCGGPGGRIPDVTLEKVLELILQDEYGTVSFDRHNPSLIECSVDLFSGTPMAQGYGRIPLVAACAVLLATEE